MNRCPYCKNNVAIKAIRVRHQERKSFDCPSCGKELRFLPDTKWAALGVLLLAGAGFFWVEGNDTVMGTLILAGLYCLFHGFKNGHLVPFKG